MDKAIFVTYAISTVGQVVRGRADKEHLPSRLATLCASVFAVVNISDDNRLLCRGLMHKYPERCCAYCKHDICDCGDNRPRFSSTANEESGQLNWKFYDWQTMLDIRYGAYNRDKGPYFIFARLSEEAQELLLFVSGFRQSNKEMVSGLDWMAQLASESADIVAWTLALASYYHVDMTMVMKNYYGKVCPGCKKEECGCPLIFRGSDETALVGTISK